MDCCKIDGSVANLAALGCVRFCFLTFLTRKIGFLSKCTRTRERVFFLEIAHKYRGSRFFSKTIDATNAGLL